MNPQMPPDFLTCWKEIAHYLRKGVRTVQRYEAELGLPVRRPLGKPRGCILITRRELDIWIMESPLKRRDYVSHAKAFSLELSSLRSSVRETQKLRKELAALRVETHQSVALLHENLDRLRKQLAPMNDIRLLSV